MFATTIIIKLSLLTSLLEKCAWNDVFPRNAILFDFCSIFMTYGVQYMQNAMQLWTGHKWVEQRMLFWSTSAPFEDKSLCRCQQSQVGCCSLSILKLTFELSYFITSKLFSMKPNYSNKNWPFFFKVFLSHQDMSLTHLTPRLPIYNLPCPVFLNMYLWMFPHSLWLSDGSHVW